MNRVTAYIGLGANLPSKAGAPSRTLAAALVELGSREGVEVAESSSVHETEPVGPAGQPRYANACAELRVTLGPRELLGVMLEVEAAFGRDRAREERWGPRTLDLDLLVYGRERIDEPGLTVPHPRMLERSFVIDPLREIAPELVESLQDSGQGS